MTLDGTNKSRSSNFELLRIASMIMIVGHHYAVHGIRHVLTDDMNTMWLSGNAANKIITSFFVPGGTIGVGIFFLLTGYFMFDKKYKIDRIFKLLAQVFFYAVLLLVTWGGEELFIFMILLS